MEMVNASLVVFHSAFPPFESHSLVSPHQPKHKRMEGSKINKLDKLNQEGSPGAIALEVLERRSENLKMCQDCEHANMRICKHAKHTNTRTREPANLRNLFRAQQTQKKFGFWTFFAAVQTQ